MDFFEINDNPSWEWQKYWVEEAEMVVCRGLGKWNLEGNVPERRDLRVPKYIE